MAQSAYNFVVKFMRDPSDNLWYRDVTKEGQVADSRKETYNHWFILYGFRQVRLGLQMPQMHSVQWLFQQTRQTLPSLPGRQPALESGSS